jgi:hypothetical protein
MTRGAAATRSNATTKIGARKIPANAAREAQQTDIGSADTSPTSKRIRLRRFQPWLRNMTSLTILLIQVEKMRIARTLGPKKKNRSARRIPPRMTWRRNINYLDGLLWHTCLVNANQKSALPSGLKV